MHRGTYGKHVHIGTQDIYWHVSAHVQIYMDFHLAYLAYSFSPRLKSFPLFSKSELALDFMLRLLLTQPPSSQPLTASFWGPAWLSAGCGKSGTRCWGATLWLSFATAARARWSCQVSLALSLFWSPEPSDHPSLKYKTQSALCYEAFFRVGSPTAQGRRILWEQGPRVDATCSETLLFSFRVLRWSQSLP